MTVWRWKQNKTKIKTKKDKTNENKKISQPSQESVIAHQEHMLTIKHRFLPALAHKFGYDSVDVFVDEVQDKYSLLTSGILDTPSTRLLLVNVSSTAANP